jgi:phage/plasmid-associated DNA primase
MDSDIDSKIPAMVEAFAWILLQRRLQPKMTYKPEKVLQAIIAYQRRNDTYRQYIEECIIEDRVSKLTLVELYNSIKEWFKDSLPGQKLPEKSEIKDYFITAWGDEGRGLKWTGYRSRTIKDDIEDGIIIPVSPDNLINFDGKPPL